MEENISSVYKTESHLCRQIGEFKPIENKDIL
jgi:hypothetical protein